MDRTEEQKVEVATPVKFVTRKQRENALYARDVMWPKIKPEQITHQLGCWRNHCGSQACFGGWVAQDPMFVAQGVRVDFLGMPTMTPEDEYAPYGSHDTSAPEALFGDRSLFLCRKDEQGTDHEVITTRLNRLIENSVVID